MKKLSSVKSSVITGLTLLSGLMFAEAAADVAGGIKSLSGLIDTITNTVVKSTATLFLSLALLAFFYGIIEYILARRSGDAAGLKKGNEFIGWSLVALFVMFSVYGIIKFSQDTLFKGQDFKTINIPDINFGGKSTGTVNNTGSTGASVGTGSGNVSPGYEGASTGAGSGSAVTLIQEANGWKYYSDGTVIGPDGTYYTSEGQITGAGGSAVGDCSSFRTSTECVKVAKCIWESMGSQGGVCMLSD